MPPRRVSLIGNEHQKDLELLHRAQKLERQTSLDNSLGANEMAEISNERRRMAEQAKLLLAQQDEEAARMGRHRLMSVAFKSLVRRWERSKWFQVQTFELMYRQALKAFHVLVQGIELLHEARMLKRGAERFLMKRSMHTWSAACATLEHAHERLGLALRRWCGRIRRVAWLTWLAAIDERETLRRALQSFISPGVRRAWTALAHTASDTIRHLEVVPRAAMAMRQSGKRRALNSWLARAAEAAECRRRLRASVDEWRGGKRRAAWYSWCELVRARQALSRASSGFRLPGLRRAMSSWVWKVASAFPTVLARSAKAATTPCRRWSSPVVR